MPTFWRGIINNRAEIIFAYKSFVWNSEATERGAVHCMIVGFTSFEDGETKYIYD